MSDEVGTWNPIIYKGSKWTKTLTLTNDDTSPVDLTGYTSKMYIGSDIEIDGIIVTNTIKFELDASDTDLITFIAARHHVDIIPSTGVEDTERILQGRAYFQQ